MTTAPATVTTRVDAAKTGAGTAEWQSVEGSDREHNVVLRQQAVERHTSGRVVPPFCLDGSRGSGLKHSRTDEVSVDPPSPAKCSELVPVWSVRDHGSPHAGHVRRRHFGLDSGAHTDDGKDLHPPSLWTGDRPHEEPNHVGVESAHSSRGVVSSS